MPQYDQGSQLYLVGFRIEPEIHDPQLYTLYVDDDRPILSKGRPIVFARPDLADAALRESDCGAAALGPAPSALYAVYDFAEAIYALGHETQDKESSLLDCINLLLDFCNIIAEPMPTEYRSCLMSLADHLTFDKHFGDFLQRSEVPRTLPMNAMFWSIGMIIYYMKLMT